MHSDSVLEDLFNGIKNGDKKALSKGLTLVESRLTTDSALSRALLSKILPYTGNSLRIGVTGAPGVGKSTFIQKLGFEISSSGKKLAILTIDPTSPSSGGSILGDKTRMEELAQIETVFIRPTPSGSAHGGISRNTRDQIFLCEAAGFDVILVETVGVGQGETAISFMVDYLLLLLLPGGGDDLQGIKRGIMEVSQAFAFTKTDLLDDAIINKSISDLTIALHMIHENPPHIYRCSGITGEGLSEIWRDIELFKREEVSSGSWNSRRENQDLSYFETIVKQQIISSYLDHDEFKEGLWLMKEKIVKREITPIEASESLVHNFLKSKGS